MIKEQLNKLMIEAMKAKDTTIVSTIRLINSKIKDKEISKRSTSSEELTEIEIIEVLQHMLKQRKQSIAEFLKGKREDLAEIEEKEIQVINKFLPEVLSKEEMNIAIEKAIEDVKAANVKDMGKVVSELKSKYSGRIDISEANSIIKEKLS